ncbi:hypothetical protein ACFPYJ_01330 [Paenibacillus solisilvae]|uniref:DUF3021 domain-containing protein n=1 Tax=Paenibacillus solisilvae TaxID=2486751 RepID=A0ABW0VUM0_9BACL
MRMRASLIRVAALALYAVSFFFMAMLMIKFSSLIFTFKNIFLILLHPIIPASLFGFLVGLGTLVVNLDMGRKLQYTKSRRVAFLSFLALILTLVQIVLVCMDGLINASLVMSCLVYVNWFIVGIYTATSLSQRAMSNVMNDELIR